MVQDAQGHEVPGASSEAVAHIDEAVRAFTLNYGDINAHLALARDASPDCRLAEVLGVWPPGAFQRRRATCEGQGHSGRESRRSYSMNASKVILRPCALLRRAAGRRPVACLDRHVMRYPHDLVAHQSALRLDGYLGRFHRAAARSARALPFWSKDQPGYGIMLSFYGFGARGWRPTTAVRRMFRVRRPSWSLTVTGRTMRSPMSWR